MGQLVAVRKNDESSDSWRRVEHMNRAYKEGRAANAAENQALREAKVPRAVRLAAKAGVHRNAILGTAAVTAPAAYVAGRSRGRSKQQVGKGVAQMTAAELGVQAMRRQGWSDKKIAAVGAGAIGTAVVAQEAGGRYIGGRRYKAGKHVNDGFFMGPAVNRGYFAAERRNTGGTYGINATRSDDMQRVQGVRKAFATRDQNSSIGTTYSHAGPKGEGLTKVTNAHTTRTGAFAGKQRGVGRNMNRDQNSTPGHTVIRTPTLREIGGKFASEASEGVKVFHPQKYGSSRRLPRDNRVFIARKDGDDVARTFSGKQKEKVGKSVMQIPDGRKAADVLMGGGGRAKSTRGRDIALGAAGGSAVTGVGATVVNRRGGRKGEVRKGMLGPVDLLVMAPHTGARVGRRIPA